jgi:hypothetical protein
MALCRRGLGRAPPLIGYFFHPVQTPLPQPSHKNERTRYKTVFAPINTSFPLLSLDFASDTTRLELSYCHQGLLLLQPIITTSKTIIPRLLVLHPAPAAAVLAHIQALRRLCAAFPRSPEQVYLRGRLPHHQRPAPVHLGRVRLSGNCSWCTLPLDYKVVMVYSTPTYILVNYDTIDKVWANVTY